MSSPRPAWDAQKADAGAAEFAGKITNKTTAKQLAELWREYLPTVGHKRLGRVIANHGKPEAKAPAKVDA